MKNRRMKQALFPICFLWLAAALLFVACEEDEPMTPPYRQEIADLPTDARGEAQQVCLDNGTNLKLETTLSGLRPDTLYRVRMLFTEREDGRIHLTDYVPILAPEVGKYASDKIVCDPLDVVACYKSGPYVNVQLALKGSAGGVHAFGFHQTDYVRHNDGARTLHALLLHHQNNDPLYYTREVFLSLPLRPLSELLLAGRDSIAVHFHTFDGEMVYRFAL